MAGITHGSGAARCRRIASPFTRWRPDTPAAITFAASTDKAFTGVAALERLASISLSGGGPRASRDHVAGQAAALAPGRLKTAVRHEFRTVLTLGQAAGAR